jgi:hypothetical protein
MDLDLRLLAQVRLESRQRYMALVIHFLTIPLYDVMTLVASGSHQPRRGWGLDPTIERQDYGACYKLVVPQLVDDKRARAVPLAPRETKPRAGLALLNRSLGP